VGLPTQPGVLSFHRLLRPKPCAMANTTVKGAHAIHGQNPQVRAWPILLSIQQPTTRLVSHRGGNTQPCLRVRILERTLLRSHRSVSCQRRNLSNGLLVYQPRVSSTEQSKCRQLAASMATSDPPNFSVCSKNFSRSSQRRRSSSSTCRLLSSSEE
jgi:hypothetical protein